jgi:hypothetical protein
MNSFKKPFPSVSFMKRLEGKGCSETKHRLACSPSSSNYRMVGDNNRTSNETKNTNGGMSVYISNPNMEDDLSSGSQASPKLLKEANYGRGHFDERVHQVRGHLLNLVKDEQPNKRSASMAIKHGPSSTKTYGAPLGVQMSKQGLQFGNNADVLKSMIRKKSGTTQQFSQGNL